jgi:hypothetical protein
MNPSTSSRVAAIFEHRADADEAIADLLTEGFAQDQIKLGLSGEPGVAEKMTEPNTAPGTVPAVLAPGYVNVGAGYPVSLNALPAGIATLNLTTEDAAFFSGQMSSGHALVVVDAGARGDIARIVLERNGGKSRPAG